MSNLIVITFDDENQAPAVFQSLKKLEHQDLLNLDDAAIIVKDADGKVHVKNLVESGVKVGAVAGGIFGLLIGGLLFPIAGLALGIAGGALIGKSFETGVDQKFVKEVKEGLKPCSSGILFIVSNENTGVLVAALEPYNGKLYQTTLDSEVEAELKKALK